MLLHVILTNLISSDKSVTVLTAVSGTQSADYTQTPSAIRVCSKKFLTTRKNSPKNRTTIHHSRKASDHAGERCRLNLFDVAQSLT